MALIALPAWAQEPAPDRPARDVVEITLARPEEDLKGRLIAFDNETLSIEIDRRQVDVPMGRVVLIEKRVRDSRWDGAVLMAAFVAACARWWCEQGLDHSSGSASARTIGGAAVGAAYGFLIDWLIHGHEVMFEAPNANAAARRSGVGVSFAVRF